MPAVVPSNERPGREGSKIRLMPPPGGRAEAVAVVAASLTGVTNGRTPHRPRRVGTASGPSGRACCARPLRPITAWSGEPTVTGLHAGVRRASGRARSWRSHPRGDHGRPAGREMAVHARVGVSMGAVVVEDDEVHGVAVVEAARLCAAAEAGQILCTEAVRRAAVSVSRFRFAASPALVGERASPARCSATPVEWAGGPASLDGRRAVVECDFAVLGPLVVRSPDGPVNIGGPRSRPFSPCSWLRPTRRCRSLV